MEQLTSKQIKDSRVLMQFIRVYCTSKHHETAVSMVNANVPAELKKYFPDGLLLCRDCAGLVAHAIEKRRKCPLDPKPSCKHCHIHCYSKDYRVKIRGIMAYSGRKMILRGRLDYLWHYLF